VKALRGGRALLGKLGRVRALVLDVDGVLTDGGLYYGEQGQALKKFHVRDGMGLRLVQEAGLSVALITGEETGIVRRRAEKLKVLDVFGGVEDKRQALDAFLASRGIAPEDAAYVGDDVNDVPALERAGFPVAVADAAPEALRAARLVTDRRGGEGAVREVCDALLAARARRR
jgi:3-deoxy-D-manno-octulosonate 8-phosphate phosphatase (KDO 8-P phosphatase)